MFNLFRFVVKSWSKSEKFQPKEVPKISEPKKFKSVPFQIPELSSKLKKNILTLPADKGSKLELLQKVSLNRIISLLSLVCSFVFTSCSY